MLKLSLVYGLSNGSENVDQFMGYIATNVNINDCEILIQKNWLLASSFEVVVAVESHLAKEPLLELE